jgi:hypothetical protein
MWSTFLRRNKTSRYPLYEPSGSLGNTRTSMEAKMHNIRGLTAAADLLSFDIPLLF